MKKKLKKIKDRIKPMHIGIFIAVLFLLFIIFSAITLNNSKEKKIREAAFSGTWYPGDKEELSAMIDKFYSNISKRMLNGSIKAIIVPHAGYLFSGQVAAHSFQELEDKYENVFLLGPSHKSPLSKAALPDVDYFRTPLGDVKVSAKTKQLIKEESFELNTEVHKGEHSLEIELPFLQKKLTDFQLVPIIVGDVNAEKLKDNLIKHVGDEDLIVVSVDLSHYHPYKEAKLLDNFTINKILELDSDGIFQAEIDAPWAVSTLIRIAKQKGWKPYLLKYANSADVSGHYSGVVGYSAIAFVEEKKDELSSEDKKFLLKLARDTLESYLKNGEMPKVNEKKLTPSLKRVQGCFTTLNKNDNLRGCIGDILPQRELYKCVMDNAINAAVKDRRFLPVKYDELKDIEIEISVLSVPEKLEFSSGEDLKNKLRPMIDGVVLRQGIRSSTYLPQVWEQLPDKELFLTSLCEKGGMNANCWKDTKTEVSTYQALVFSEKEIE